MSTPPGNGATVRLTPMGHIAAAFAAHGLPFDAERAGPACREAAAAIQRQVLRAFARDLRQLAAEMPSGVRTVMERTADAAEDYPVDGGRIGHVTMVAACAVCGSPAPCPVHGTRAEPGGGADDRG